MSMSQDSWPPALKEWVSKCLGMMTDLNRAEAQTELKQVIHDAFVTKSLWTTDWAGMQLQSLIPKPMPTVNNLKRKKANHVLEPPVTKKQKKNNAFKKAEAVRNADFNDRAALDRRAQRFQREHEIERQKNLTSQTASLTLGPHARYAHPQPFDNTPEPEGDPNVMDWDKHTIVGTNTELFKDYLRLTSEPKPEQIRPLPVLQQAFEQIKIRFRNRAPYNWICNQLKSLRQDLVVQRIKNDFTAKVYESHARMALENNDMVEYNQCQATLKLLYELGIPGANNEFTAYRILMLLHGRNRSESNLYVGQLTAQQKEDKAVQHALNVQRALAMGNYHRLMRLYEEAPNMSAYIMDHFIPRERARALICITRAYKQIPISFLQNELCLETLEGTHQFLQDFGCSVYTTDNKSVDCAAIDQATLQKSFEQKYRKINIKGAI
ncbi:SAC3/GANP/Nin1/mts3/eIF-3 p25 family-domain-containing protein [Schizophyllum fasciatum]